MSHRALDQGSGRRRAGSSDQLGLLQSPETSPQHWAVGSRWAIAGRDRHVADQKTACPSPLLFLITVPRRFLGHVTGSEIMTTAMNVLRRPRDRAPALLELSTEVRTDVA
jgi:hypothetical protein